MNLNNNFFRKNPRKNPKDQFRTNRNIQAKEVRITGENIESRIISLEEALKISSDLELDLIEINSNTTPPICKVYDYSKFLYEKKKKDKENKSQNKHTLKEIKLGPNIQKHDIDFKLKNSKKFLELGDKLKVHIQFKGRQIMYKEQGELILLQFIESLSDVGKPEALPKMEGKNMYVIITPKK